MQLFVGKSYQVKIAVRYYPDFKQCLQAAFQIKTQSRKCQVQSFYCRELQITILEPGHGGYAICTL
jgi:hypothetical protein